MDRHDEKAIEIANKFVPFSVKNYALAEAIAAALRETTREAAWDGFMYGRAYQRTDYEDREREINDEMTAKYGPREAS